MQEYFTNFQTTFCSEQVNVELWICPALVYTFHMNKVLCDTLTEQQYPLLLLNVAGTEAVFNIKAVLDFIEGQGHTH